MVSPVLKQTWIVVGVLLNMLGQGMLLGYTSILLPSLKSPDSDIKVDIHTASIIVSIIAIAAMPGLLVTSLLMELYGRRFAYGFIVVPGVVGWLFIYYAKSVLILVIGRGLGGFSAGALVSLGAVVIGEYTSPKNRGMFLNLKTAAICLGNLIVHVLGQIYHWRTVALISLTPITMSLLIIFTWPESPAWLASKYKYKECEKSFFWLRGNNLESTNEMEKLLRAQKVKKPEATDANITCKLVEIIKKFKRRDFAKPIVIVLFGFLLLESCGRHIFPAFSLQIIKEITGNNENIFYYNLGIDAIITVSSLFSSVLVKMMKRRTLLFSTGFTAVAFLFSICGYLYLVSKDVISNDRTYIPISLFVVYFIFSNLGCTTIPLALLGEIFPLDHRGASSCIAGFLMSICMTLGMNLTPYLLVYVKIYGTFALLGAVMGSSLIVLWLILPETKDKTLQEIENYINFGEFNIKDDEEAKLKMMPI